jgi:predicted nucleic acid-binding protein
MRGRALVIDANLLLLLVIGASDPSDIARSKRLQAFAPSDFELLVRYGARFTSTVVTPHGLTEVSNLIGSGDDENIRRRNGAFARLVASFVEVHVPAIEITRSSPFYALGLSDAAQLDAARERGRLLTADGRLAQVAAGLRVPVTHFDALRQQVREAARRS